VSGEALAFAPFTRARSVRAELVAGILRSGRTVPDEGLSEDLVAREPPRSCRRGVDEK